MLTGGQALNDVIRNIAYFVRRSLGLISISLFLAGTGMYMSFADTGSGSVSLNAVGTAYTQNFDTLSNTGTTNSNLPPGWFLTESGGGARDNEQYRADNGGSGTGDTYSYGSTGSSDRAFGALRSGTLIPVFGASFTNNTGSVITELDISYTGEQWRLGTASRGSD